MLSLVVTPSYERSASRRLSSLAQRGGPRDMLKMFLGIETPRDMLKMFFGTNNFMYLSQKSGHLGGCMTL